MSGKKLVPKRRFRGLEGDWDNTIYNNLLDSSEGIRRGPFGSALKKNLFVSDSDYVVYEQQNAIHNNYNYRYFISKNKYEELIRFSLKEGDFIMSGAGTIGAISMVPKGIKSGVINQALIRLRLDNKKTDSMYFLQWMRSDFMQSKLKDANPASAMENLVPMSELKEWDVFIPTLEEQQKIGRFFKVLDKRIANQEKKIAKVKALKSAYLTEMFPQEGETVPERRFKGFYRKWKSTVIKEISEVNPSSPLPERFNYVDLESVMGTQLINHRLITRDNSPSRAQRLARKGDIFYQTVRPYQQNNYLFMLGDTNYVFSTGYAQLRPKIDSKFLFTKLTTRSFLNKVLDRCTGTGFPAISPNDLINIKIKIPSLEEQQKIGSFFKNLDEQIETEENKLGKLKAMKEAYLEEMFV